MYTKYKIFTMACFGIKTIDAESENSLCDNLFGDKEFVE